MPVDVAARVFPAARFRVGVARRASLVAGLVATFLVPWSALLAATLPGSYDAQHWRLAWVGLDAGEAVAAALSALCLAIGSPFAPLAVTATATLLLTDAWFDVTTSHAGLDHLLAVVEAFGAALPLAAAGYWLAVWLVLRVRPQPARSPDESSAPALPRVSRR